MPKTPIKNHFKRKLAVVNDQLCYHLFADKEVEHRLSEKGIDCEGEYTSSLFPDNEFSQRLNVKQSQLAKFRNDVGDANKAVCLVLGTEYLLSFIEEVELFREEVVPGSPQKIFCDAAENQLLQKLLIWERRPVERPIFRTVTYLRLRRNHLAHARTELSSDLKRITSQESTELNSYWGKRRTKLDGFDFSDKAVNRFSTEESFSIINLIRVCIEEIDLMVVNSIGVMDIMKYELNVMRFPNIVGKNTSRKYSTRLKNIIRRKYLIDVDLVDSERIVQARLESTQ